MLERIVSLRKYDRRRKNEITGFAAWIWVWYRKRNPKWCRRMYRMGISFVKNAKRRMWTLYLSRYLCMHISNTYLLARIYVSKYCELRNIPYYKNRQNYFSFFFTACHIIVKREIMSNYSRLEHTNASLSWISF